MKKLQRAGEVLAKIWGELVLDDHPVISEYVENQVMIIMSCGLVNIAESLSTCSRLSSVMTGRVVLKCVLPGVVFSNRSFFRLQYQSGRYRKVQ